MSIKLNFYKMAAIGSREEAVICTDAHRDNWEKSKGAQEWLKREWTAASASAD
jgi:hypothetical protein